MTRSDLHLPFLAAALAWTAVLFTLTHIPTDSFPDFLRLGLWDKYPHAVAYGVLAALLLPGLRAWGAGPRWKRVAVLFAAVAVIGALDETTQPLAGRTCDFQDWVADLIGALLACALGLPLLGRFLPGTHPPVPGAAPDSPAPAEELPQVLEDLLAGAAMDRPARQ